MAPLPSKVSREKAHAKQGHSRQRGWDLKHCKHINLKLDHEEGEGMGDFIYWTIK